MLEKSYYSKMRAILPETVSLIFDENGPEDLQSELLCIVGNLIDAEIQGIITEEEFNMKKKQLLGL